MPQIPNEPVSSRSAIRIGGVVNAPEVQHRRDDDRRLAKEREQFAKVVVQESIPNPALVRRGSEGRVREEEARNAVEGVFGAVSHWRGNGDELRPRNEHQKQQLREEEAEAKNGALPTWFRKIRPQVLRGVRQRGYHITRVVVTYHPHELHPRWCDEHEK